MKNKFIEYYSSTPDDFQKMWEDCIFVVDANVILNVYKYSPNTADQLIKTLTNFSDRLWVPNQAALEFQKNRLNIIHSQKEAFTQLKDNLIESRNQLISNFKKYSRHPTLLVQDYTTKIENFYSEIIEDLDSKSLSHPDLMGSDNLLDKITFLFDGKVGDCYSSEKIQEIKKCGSQRFELKIPPGYEDIKKNTGEKFGDLIIWKQILDFSKEKQKPIILITDDGKEDWWHIFKGKTIGPRVELIREIWDFSNVKFHMYNTDQFLSKAGAYLKKPVQQIAIDEIKEIREKTNWEALIIAISGGMENVANAKNIKERISEIEMQIDFLKNETFENLDGKPEGAFLETSNFFDELKILESEKDILVKSYKELLNRSRIVQFMEASENSKINNKSKNELLTISLDGKNSRNEYPMSALNIKY